MKKVKVRTSLLLIGLLLIPSNTHCSWSWWQNVVQAPLKTITESIDQETMKKLLPLAVFATFVGFLYWMSKKKSSQVTEDSVLANVTYSLEQYPVYNQFNDNGGGRASCAYHALLRSMQLVNGKGNNEPEQQLKTHLMSPVMIARYFGAIDSDWRGKIIQERQRNGLYSYLVEQCNNAVQEEYKTIYVLPFQKLSRDMADKNFLENISFDTFTETLEQKLVENGSVLDDTYKNIDLKAIRQNIFLGQNIIRMHDLVVRKVNSTMNQSDLEGDWLEGSEIQFLWNYEKNKAQSLIHKNIISDVCIIPDTDWLGEKDLDPVSPSYIRNNILTYSNEKRPVFFTFIIGTMKQLKNYKEGHWYSLVMHQSKEKGRKYYILDSANNDRPNNDDALRIIRRIEFEVKEYMKY